MDAVAGGGGDGAAGAINFAMRCPRAGGGWTVAEIDYKPDFGAVRDHDARQVPEALWVLRGSTAASYAGRTFGGRVMAWMEGGSSVL